MERRLATIMMADIVGYSRLMGLDEARLFERAHGRQVDLETTFSVRDLAAPPGYSLLDYRLLAALLLLATLTTLAVLGT